MIQYLNAQIAAGAQAVQLFDSWVGCLGPHDYRRYVLPHTRAVIQGLTPGVPVIHFAAGNASLLPLVSEAGGDVIGIDWRVELDDGWNAVGHDRAVQGNLDPAALLAEPAEIRSRAADVLRPPPGRRPYLQPGARHPAANARRQRALSGRCRARVKRAMTRLSSTLLVILAAVLPASRRRARQDFARRQNDSGILTHDVTSDYQAGVTQVRVLLPREQAAGARFPVIYVLPVEAGARPATATDWWRCRNTSWPTSTARFSSRLVLAFAVVCRPSDRLDHSPGKLFSESRGAAGRSELPGHRRAECAVAAWFQQVRLGRLVLLARHPDTFGARLPGMRR